jgi:hypothetical protein
MKRNFRKAIDLLEGEYLKEAFLNQRWKSDLSGLYPHKIS